MPTQVPDLPDNLPECHRTILRQWNRITELEVRAEQTVGGFLDRNGKAVLAVLVGLITAFGGGNIVANYLNHEKIKEAKTTTEQVAERTNEVGSGVDDVKRELKKKKGPFGE